MGVEPACGKRGPACGQSVTMAGSGTTAARACRPSRTSSRWSTDRPHGNFRIRGGAAHVTPWRAGRPAARQRL